MYLSLLQIKNFRCFDGNEHSITFKKGLFEQLELTEVV